MIDTIKLYQWVAEMKLTNDALISHPGAGAMAVGMSVAYQSVMDKMLNLALDDLEKTDKPEPKTIHIPIQTV